jgi:beta-phosphoglucomutase-like phosphatase (HAD superfamily)
MSLRDRFDLVVLDWAGTMVDFGCQAPVKALVEAFAAEGVAMCIGRRPVTPAGSPQRRSARGPPWCWCGRLARLAV